MNISTDIAPAPATQALPPSQPPEEQKPFDLRKSTTVISVLRREFLTICGGDVIAALFLSNACRWDSWKRNAEKGGDADGWFHMSAAEWHEEIGATRKTLDTARAIVRKLGIVNEKLRAKSQGKNDVAIHYQVNWERLRALVPEQDDCPKRTNH